MMAGRFRVARESILIGAKLGPNNCKQSFRLANAMSHLRLKIEFGGGLELLFSNQRTHLVTVPPVVPQGNGEEGPVDINFLVHWLKDNLLKERPELFMEGRTV